MPFPYIKIFGLRNSGTNYLSQIVSKNIDVKILPGTIPRRLNSYSYHLTQLLGKSNLISAEAMHETIRDVSSRFLLDKSLGWKHKIIPSPDELRNHPISKQTLFLTLTKNPYSWLLSLYKRPYHQLKTKKDLSFHEFYSSEWKSVKRECGPEIFKNPIDIWNKKNRSYIRLNDGFPVINLRYEDLLENPENILDKIVGFSNLNRKSEEFINIVRSTKGDKNKDFYHYQRYYLNQEWKQKLADEDILFINECLDSEVLRFFDYEFLGVR